MKKNMLPVLGIFVYAVVSCSNNSSTPTDPPQNKNYLVSMTGIDSIQLGMTKVELEKLVNTSLDLQHIKAGNWSDTIKVKYKGMDLTLCIEGDNEKDATLRGIETTNPSCRTSAGLGVGTEKIKVIDTYPINTKYIAPEYEEYPVRSITRSAVAVMDTLDTRALVFHIIKRKVISVEVRSYYEFY